MIGAVLVVSPMGSYVAGLDLPRPLCICPAHGMVPKRRKVVLTRWMPVLRFLLPRWIAGCLRKRSLLCKEPQAAGQQEVQALIRVRQSLPRSPGMTRMRAGEHMQQA